MPKRAGGVNAGTGRLRHPLALTHSAPMPLPGDTIVPFRSAIPSLR